MRKWWKWYVALFQGSFLVGLWNATSLGPSAKFPYFKTQIATFVGISNKLILFYWNAACISWGIYKFATFSINYVKLKHFRGCSYRDEMARLGAG